MIPLGLLQSVGNVFIMQSADADRNKKSQKTAIIKNPLTVAAKRENWRRVGAHISIFVDISKCVAFQILM